MSRTFSKKPLALALGTAFALGGASAQASVFSLTDLGSGYMVAQGTTPATGDKSKAEHKCGEGKCGGSKAKADGKSAEGKCGEGKCGEGKCGGTKTKADAKAAEGKCGEGKCGEGKCGGKK